MSIPSNEKKNREQNLPDEQNGIPKPGTAAAARSRANNKNGDRREDKDPEDDTLSDGFGSDAEEANGGTTGAAARKGGL